MDNKYEEQIEEILSNFNFRKVRDVMESLEWTWYGCGGSPNEYALIKAAERILESVVKFDKSETHRSVATGGFVARYTDGLLTLSFCIESFSGDLVLDEE